MRSKTSRRRPRHTTRQPHSLQLRKYSMHARLPYGCFVMRSAALGFAFH
jgi:hypothetical protein